MGTELRTHNRFNSGRHYPCTMLPTDEILILGYVHIYTQIYTLCISVLGKVRMGRLKDNQ